GPLQLLHRIFGQLVMLEEPVLNSRAWIATITGTGGPPSLAQHSFMIFAANSRDAEERLRKVLSAMQPGAPPLLPNAILWCQARKEHRPDGPVGLGVRGLVCPGLIPEAGRTPPGGPPGSAAGTERVWPKTPAATARCCYLRGGRGRGGS